MRNSFVKSKTLLLSSTALIAASSIASAQVADPTHSWIADTKTDNVSVDYTDPGITNYTVDTTSGSATGNADIYEGHVVNVDGINGARRFAFSDNRDNIESTIKGGLQSNIQVVIIDKDGVFFEKPPEGNDVNPIDVQGIITSTGELLDGIVPEGDEVVFVNVSEGGLIVNNRTITVSEAGLAAFVAPTVINNGVINARLGNVVMASGDTVTLDMYGDGLVEVAVDGEIEDALVRNAGTISTTATVQITAEAAREVADSVVNIDGIEAADSVSVQGGKIVLYANGGDVVNNGLVEGGDVDITANNFIQGSGLVVVPPQRPDVEQEFNVDGEESIVGFAVCEGDVQDSTVGITGVEGAQRFVFTDNRKPLSELLGGRIETNGDDVNIEVENVALFGGYIEANGGDINIDNSGVFYSAQAETLRTEGFGEISLNQNRRAEPEVCSTDHEFPEDQYETAELRTSLIAVPVQPNGSIQNAIDALSNTGYGPNTINVGAGTYNESVNLDHANTGLLGANASTFFSPSGSAIVQLQNRGPESIIIPNSPGFHVTADNTAVAGFAIMGDGTDVGIFVDGANNVLLANNITTNVTNGIFADGASEVFAVFNDITGNQEGIYFEGTEDSSIFLNEIRNTGSDGILVRNSDNGFIGLNTIRNAGSNGIRLGVSNEVDVFGNTINTTVRDGIRVENGILANVSNNTINNAGNDGIEALGNNGLIVEGNTVRNSAVDGIDVTTRDLEGTLIGGNTVNGTGENGIKHEGPDGVIISGNRVRNTGTNGISSTTLNQFEDSYGEFPTARGQINIYENDIDDAGTNGIFVNLTDNNALIDYNNINTTGEHGIYLEESADANVVGNEVRNAGKDGIYLRNSDNGYLTLNDVRDAGSNGIRANVSNDVYIDENEVNTTRRDGIRIENGVNGTVVNNIIRNAGNDGIEALGNNGLTIQRNIVNNSAVDGIDVTSRDLEGTQILDNEINGTGENGINHEGPDGTTIAGNTIDNAGLNGIFSTTLNIFADSYGAFPTARGQLIVDNNTVRNSGANGIYIEDTNNDPRLTNNIVNGTGANGIYLERSDNGFVAFNTVRNTGSDGILLRNSDDGFVGVNTISDAGSNGIRLAVANNAFVDQNNINTTRRDGIRVENGVDALIALNTINNAGNDGIEALGNNGLVIDGNTVRNSAVDGIDVTSRDLEVTRIINNKVNGTGENGINHEGPDGTIIAGNTVDNAGLNGIYSNTINMFADSYGEFPTARGQLIVENNTVRTSGTNGIFIENTDNDPIVQFNTVNGTGENGIYLENSANSFVFLNTVRNTGSDGILIRNSDDAVLDENAINDAGSNGIRLAVANNAVVGENQINTTRRDGIRVENGVNALIVGNTINNAGNDGIEALGNNGLVIDGNTVRNSAVDGIDVTSRDLEGTQIINNTVNTTGANGINHEGPDGTTIAGNTVDNAGMNGIYSNTLNMFEDSYGEFPTARGQLIVDDNTVRTSGANGIFIENTDNDPQITNNRVNGTGENGIYLENSANGQLYTNTVLNTGLDGILLRNSDRADAQFNVVRNAGDNGIRLAVANYANLYENEVNTTVRDGIRVENGINAVLFFNRVNNAGNDGIEALGNNGLSIDNNTVRNSGADGIDVTSRDLDGASIVLNTVVGATANGIKHEGPSGITIAANTVRDVSGNGIYTSTLNQFADSYGEFPTARGQIQVQFNDVKNVGENGIVVELTDNNPLVEENIISNVAENGVLLVGVGDLELTSNDIRNSAVNGLFVEGEGNGLVTLSGNIFVDNGTIGGAQARFESGDIDFTGTSNVFTNTAGVAATAIQFDDISVFGTGLNLVGNTLGSTEFTGYTPAGSVYVEISEGTFLDGGTPILIDADSVSFDGVIGGAATPAELLDIEDRLIDADDAPVDARGQIFEPPVVVLPPAPPAPAAAAINTEDFIQEGPEVQEQPETTASLRINGLPSTGEVGFQGALGLNNLEPQAGDEAEGAELASISPEAGESQQVTCAGDLANSIGNGPVTYGFGGTFEDGIIAAASCSV